MEAGEQTSFCPENRCRSRWRKSAATKMRFFLTALSSPVLTQIECHVEPREEERGAGEGPTGCRKAGEPMAVMRTRDESVADIVQEETRTDRERTTIERPLGRQEEEG